MQELSSYEELLRHIRDDEAALFYFSTPDCGVCKSVKPKVMHMAEEHFPRLKCYYIDIDAVPEARGQCSAYSVPLILVYFRGKEYVRMARNFGITELGQKIDRYYSMMFETAEE